MLHVDGRSPSLRVVVLIRPSRFDPVAEAIRNSPLTVAGAASASVLVNRTEFPFDPLREPSALTLEGHGVAVNWRSMSRLFKCRLVSAFNPYSSILAAAAA